MTNTLTTNFISTTQESIKRVMKQFKEYTKIEVSCKYLEKGDKHRTGLNGLGEDNQGVYIFITDTYCLKVGSVGNNSKPRWNSNHYTKPFILSPYSFKFSNSLLSKSLVTKKINNPDKTTGKRIIMVLASDSVEYFNDDAAKKELEKLVMLVQEIKERVETDKEEQSKMDENEQKEIQEIKKEEYKVKSSEATNKFRTFIEQYTHRFELKIKSQGNTNAIKLLESMLIYALNPVYEGHLINDDEE